MPFTFSHPAFIIPFLNKKIKFSSTALIVGSMAPDFEFFFQLREVDNVGHHFSGIFLFDLPLTLLLCFLYHGLVRNFLIANLPLFLLQRVKDIKQFDWFSYFKDHWIVVIYSSLFGILSHLLLDGFTHYDGLAVLRWSLLSETLQVGDYVMPIFFFLQVFLSVIGLLYTFYVIMSYPKAYFHDTSIYVVRGYWPAFVCLALLIFSIRYLFWPEFNTFWGLVMAFLGSLSYSLIALSFFLNVRKKRSV